MYQPIQILACQMFLSAEKDLKDQITLEGTPQPGSLNVLKKNAPLYLKLVLFLCHSR
jgi:hypothetical protein